LDTTSTDRRVRRSRRAIRQALNALIAEKGYNAVTVSDILEVADVGRSTFYAHFRDKEDVLLSGFDDIRSALSQSPPGDESGVATAGEFLGPVRSVFEHVGRYRQAWKPLVLKGGADVVVRILRDASESLIRDYLTKQCGDAASEARIEATTQYLAGALMGLLTWWLDSEAPESAADVYRMYRRLATQGAKRFLSTS
jgi:AcrR family transcriptional regulator